MDRLTAGSPKAADVSNSVVPVTSLVASSRAITAGSARAGAYKLALRVPGIVVT
jgi:hypothetical protein